MLRGLGSFLLLITTCGLMALERPTYSLSADNLGSLTFLSRLLASLVHGGVNRLLRYERSAREFTSQHFYCKLQTPKRRFTVLVLSSQSPVLWTAAVHAAKGACGRFAPAAVLTSGQTSL